MKCVWVPTLILFVVLLKTNKQKNIFIPGTWQVLHLGHLFWVIHFLWSPVLSWCHSNIIFAFSEVFLQYSCLSEGLVQLPQDSFPSASRTSNDQSLTICTDRLLECLRRYQPRCRIDSHSFSQVFSCLFRLQIETNKNSEVYASTWLGITWGIYLGFSTSHSLESKQNYFQSCLFVIHYHPVWVCLQKVHCKEVAVK